MVKSFLDYLTPQRCNITLKAKQYEDSEECLLEEKYFHAKYGLYDFDEDFMRRLCSMYTAFV